MTLTVVMVETVFIVVVVVVAVVVEVASVPAAVVVVCIGIVRSVGETGEVAWVVFIVIGVSASVAVVSKGYTVVIRSSTNGLIVNLYNTYAKTPRARMVPRMRRTE